MTRNLSLVVVLFMAVALAACAGSPGGPSVVPTPGPPAKELMQRLGAFESDENGAGTAESFAPLRTSGTIEVSVIYTPPVPTARIDFYLLAYTDKTTFDLATVECRRNRECPALDSNLSDGVVTTQGGNSVVTKKLTHHCNEGDRIAVYGVVRVGSVKGLGGSVYFTPDR